MRLNKEKRIGSIIVITEGEYPEFDILKGIFHELLGYKVTLCKRSDKEVVELRGRDEYSRVILLNSPTSNIISIKNKDEFYDYLFTEVAEKYDVDLFNCPTYIIFDRDRINNRLGVVKELICSLNQSLTDSDEQNGLLLLSYPSIEAFKVSMYEDNSSALRFSLGRELKSYVSEKSYTCRYDEAALTHAANELAKFLSSKNIIHDQDDIVNKMDSLGINILNCETDTYEKNNVFDCVSQVAEMFIDLGIIEL